MTTLALIGGGVVVIGLLVWWLVRTAKKSGVTEQNLRDKTHESDIRKKQAKVKPTSDKRTSDRLRKGQF